MLVWSDEEAKAVAIAMLRDGEITPSEAAELAGVSRQLVRQWCITAGIDWRRARNAWVSARWLERHGRRPVRQRKNGLRRLAREAKAEWDRRA